MAINDSAINEYMRTHFRHQPSFSEMIMVEAIDPDLMDNATTREAFRGVCDEENVRSMIRAILNQRPPFEAVVDLIEEICSRPDSQLNISRDVNRWHEIHNSLGKMVSYVLSLYGIHPVPVYNENGEFVSGKYRRRRLKSGTQFRTAVVFEIPDGLLHDTGNNKRMVVMGAVGKDTSKEDNRNTRSNRFRDAKEILHNRIIAPVIRRGYVDVYDMIGKNNRNADIREKLETKGFPVWLFDEFKLRKSVRNPEPKSLNAIIDAANMLLSRLEQPLKDYEQFAICYFVFWHASNREQTVRMVKELLSYYGLEKEYRFFQNEPRILYDPNQVEINSASSVDEFTKILSDSISDKKGQIYYRGHGSVSYELLPSLFRNEGFFKNERNMYLDLITRCPGDFSETRNHIDILAHMQHYGLPTRLLDVTSNALTALYFTCESNASKYGEVVMLEIDPSRMKHYQDIETVMLSSLPLLEHTDLEYLYEYCKNQANPTNESLEALEKLKAEMQAEKHYSTDSYSRMITLLNSYFLVSPQKLNRRMMNQDGAFILCGLFDRIYDQRMLERKDYKGTSHLEEMRVKRNGKRVIIIVDNKDEIMKSLNTYGINKTRIYPEIDNVSAYIKGQFKTE